MVIARHVIRGMSSTFPCLTRRRVGRSAVTSESLLSANDTAQQRRPLVRRNVAKNRNAAAVGCSGWFAGAATVSL
jgi:hypothetical protein